MRELIEGTYGSGTGNKNNDTPFSIPSSFWFNFHEMLKNQTRQVEWTCKVDSDGEFPEIQAMWFSMSINDLRCCSNTGTVNDAS